MAPEPRTDCILHKLDFTQAAFNAQAATGAPVKAQEYEDGITVVPRTRQDLDREARVKQGGTTKHELSSLMNFHQGFFITFFNPEYICCFRKGEG